jgi:N-methylhydantoinase A
MRYRGQEHAVRVPVPAGAGVDAIEALFHAEHERAYTFRLADAPCEIVTFHLASHFRLPRPFFADAGAAGRARPKGKRVVDFDVDGSHEASVFERSELPAGFAVEGPLIVEEPSSTTLVHPGQALEVDGQGNLVIHIRPPE